MSVEIVTKEDLLVLRIQLMNDIKTIMLAQQAQSVNQAIEGYRTKDVRKILGCSVNKLVSLRAARKVRWKKIGGTVYYNRDDVRRLVEEGY
jgi:hypothetical protein